MAESNDKQEAGRPGNDVNVIPKFFNFHSCYIKLNKKTINNINYNFDVSLIIRLITIYIFYSKKIEYIC